jgi:L-lactate dehydrogenase (cytochrome)
MTIVNIEDLRLLARKRLPRAVFDFIDGGSFDEVTLRANRADLERIRFRPRVLVDVSKRKLSSSLFGVEQALPFVLAPVGMAGVFARQGEIQAARAAERCGIPFCLSMVSICSIEEVRAATRAPFWFQLLMNKDRDQARRVIERAQAAGCQVLVHMIDAQMGSKRERDLRNGYTAPPKVTVSNALDTARRIGWILDVLLGPRITFGNLRDPAGKNEGLISLSQRLGRDQDLSLSWKDFAWVRSLWKGRLLIKGILSAEDARLAVEHGADGVVVSNHGGRQLDGAPSTISVLPAIADAVKGRATVLFDGGIRRGQDVIKALAMGADGCLIGRAYSYGLAAMGEAGVERAIRILEAEMSTTMALLGRNSIAEFDSTTVDDSLLRAAYKASGASPTL